MNKRFFVAILIAVLAVYFIFFNGASSKIDKRPNIIVILLDTLRADHLSFYGYERDTTPNLDQFARENIAASYAVVTSPWTPPSVASLFTGQYVTTHGHVPPNSRSTAAKSGKKLNAALLTMPEILKSNGYQTAAVSPNPWITSMFGFDAGFDKFEYLHRVSAGKITAAGKNLLSEMSKNNNPFFLYLHYFDPHKPYDPPAEYKGYYQGPLKSRTYDDKSLRMLNVYDAEIRYMDSSLGELFSYLKKNELYDNTIIVIVGDHGEQFMEHGDYEHGNQLFNEEVHVPLFFKTSSPLRSKKIEETVSMVDILPTILELSAIQNIKGLQGVSLLDQKNLDAREGVFSEIGRKYNQRAFISKDRRKMIADIPKDQITSPDWLSKSQIRFFDSLKDYTEAKPLTEIDQQDYLKADLKELYEKILKEHAPTDAPEEAKVDQETLDQLESLGYLK